MANNHSEMFSTEKKLLIHMQFNINALSYVFKFQYRDLDTLCEKMWLKF